MASNKFGMDIGTVNRIFEDENLSGIDVNKISSIVDRKKASQYSSLGVRIAWDLLNGTIDLNNIDALLRDSYFIGVSDCV